MDNNQQSLDQIFRETPLSERSTNLGYDKEVVDSLAQFNHNVGIAPSYEVAANDIINSINTLAQKPVKSINECFSLFNGRNGDQVLNILKDNGHIDMAASTDLSQLAKLAGYSNNHLVLLSSNAHSLQTKGTVDLNLIVSEAKSLIEADAVKINEGTASFEGFPLFDEKFKNGFTQSLDQYANSFDIHSIDIIKKDVASFNYKIQGTNLDFDKVKELIQGGQKFANIKEFTHFSKGEISRLEEQYKNINKQELNYSVKLQERVAELKKTVNEAKVDNGFTDIIKTINKTSKSSTQAEMNMGLKGVSGSIQAIRAMQMLQNVGRKILLNTVAAFSPARHLGFAKALKSGVKGVSSFTKGGVGAIKILNNEKSVHNAPTAAMQAILHSMYQGTIGTLQIVKSVGLVIGNIGKFVPMPLIGKGLMVIGGVVTAGASAGVVLVKASAMTTQATLGVSQKLASKSQSM